ncbi:A/G-specific adenine glycosylase [Heliobacterium undosum]|uniref:Adenine DNA glycosylase n=1 Tax=Heliomicrobium undosum TaxID=121734 RepID=A0A845L867_9FIRM|nr:A/G-specific adenine glycosylase [Heliomicrobium undosum]MZP31225.1 A/G-specific adenine glycosylase [Heliomicrobium undosum]
MNWAQQLLHWYDANKRDLPWRRTKDPYAIWVSEVMLQQTRVETVIPYYHTFLGRFPDPAALAAASEEVVLKGWEGLGYYSRARHLQAAARQIVERYGGQIPADPDRFRSLPGVGPYTCGAVMSIAFALPEPAVDGNVCRVFSRFFGWSDPVGSPSLLRQARQASQAQLDRLPRERIADWTQALMELGALVCLPRSARCEDCPLAADCVALQDGTVEALPVRKARKENPVIRRDALLLTDDQGRLLLHQRPEEGLLAGMWELPSLEEMLAQQETFSLGETWSSPEGTRALQKGQIVIDRSEPRQFRHVFTHLTWIVDVYPARWSAGDVTTARQAVTEMTEGAIRENTTPYGEKGKTALRPCMWSTSEDRSRLPMNRLTRNILKHYGMI